jgi:hypothetical protein
LKFIKSVIDPRGRIVFCKHADIFINLVETKQGFSRGGHYHPFPSDHILIKGKIEFKEVNLDTHMEKIRILQAPCDISVNANVAHILTALENSLFVEFFTTEYSAINYFPYRKIVNKKMIEN